MITTLNTIPGDHSSFFERLNILIAEAKKLGLTKEADSLWKKQIFDVQEYNLNEIVEENKFGAFQVATKQVRQVDVKKLPIPILPHDILLVIMEYIHECQTFLRWIEALKDYPTAGDLPLILEFKRVIGLDSFNFWPEIRMWNVEKGKRTIENARLLHGVSHFFRSIDFGELGVFWDIDLVHESVGSVRPFVSLEVEKELNSAQVHSLVQCKVSGLTLRLFHRTTMHMLFSRLPEITGLVSLCLDTWFVPRSLSEEVTNVLCNALKKSNIKQLGIQNAWLSLTTIIESLPLTKLEQIVFSSIVMTIPDMNALSSILASSKLKKLEIYSCNFVYDMDDDDAPEAEWLYNLVNGIVKSQVVELAIDACLMESLSIQHLLRRLNDMKSLKLLSITNEGELENGYCKFEHAPFYLKAALRSSASVIMEFLDEDGKYLGKYEMAALAQKYKRFKETHTQDEREFFYNIFRHDDSSIFGHTMPETSDHLFFKHSAFFPRPF